MKKCIVSSEGGKICLPDTIPCENIMEWNTYLNMLYDDVFKPDFLDSFPTFRGWRVLIRKEPRDGAWEHGFTHMTHEDIRHSLEDPNDRVPDLRRSERLNWVRVIIEHDRCLTEYQCERIWYWEEMFRGRVRIHLLFAEERFLVVLERAKSVYFIITSLYLEKDWEMEKRRKKYERYKMQKTPLV